MRGISTILNMALAVAAIVSVGGVGYLRGTISNLRGQLADADREITKLKEQRAEDRAVIERQNADISALQRTVTGEAHLIALEEALGRLHKQAMDHWKWEEARHAEHIAALKALAR